MSSRTAGQPLTVLSCGVEVSATADTCASRSPPRAESRQNDPVATWGLGIFENDTAADVHEHFLALIEDGLSPQEATKHLQDDEGVGRDRDDDNDFWLALAATQHQRGQVADGVIERALAISDDPDEIARWSPADRKQRKQNLAELRATLERPAVIPPPPLASAQPRTVPVAEGSVFAVPSARVAGHEVIGLIARLDPQGNIVANFYSGVPLHDIVTAAPILIAKTDIDALREAHWPLIGRVPNWKRERQRWSSPTFSHQDLLRPERWVLRVSGDSDLLLWETDQRVTEAEAAQFPPDGSTGHLLIQERLTRLLL